MAVTNAVIERVDTSSGIQVTLAGPDRNRRGLLIYNESAEILFMACLDVVTETEYTYPIKPGQAMNLRGNPIYVGIVTGKLDNAEVGAAALVTEFYG